MGKSKENGTFKATGSANGRADDAPKEAVSRQPSTRSSAASSRSEDDDELHLKYLEYPEHFAYHMGKGGQFKTKGPIDIDDPDSTEPGCGCPTDTRCGKCAHFWGPRCLCPTKVAFNIGWKRVVTRVVMCLLFWGFFWSITAITDQSALPGGNVFGILMVFLFGLVGEALIEKIPLPFDLPGLPPLLASLVIGIGLRNIPGINCARWILPNWSYTLRQMSLGIILGEAGVEVDKQQMYRLRWVVPRLSFLPCLSESFSWGIFAHWTLQLPWEWSFMLGFVCGAVAPACVVPSMIRFQARGMGVLRGCCTLFMSAASIDDIIAINGFNIVMTITFASNVGVGFDIGVALVEIALGIILGMICGYLMWVFPDVRQHNIVRDRAFLLVFTSWFLIFMTNVINLSGAGTLGTLTCSFVASLGWPEEQVAAVGKVYKSLWFWFQPILFGLTGANVVTSTLVGRTVGIAIGTLCMCLVVRLTVAGSAVSFLGWRYREKFMAAITWVPKATVQAAIGGVALDHANDLCEGKKFPPLCNSTSIAYDLSTTMPTSTAEQISTTYITNATMANETAALRGTTTTMTTPVGMSTMGGTTANMTNVTTQYLATTAPDCVWDYSAYAPLSPTYCNNITYWGTIILQVSVIVILVTAPIGVFLIGVFGPHLLKVDDPNLTQNQGADETSVELGDGSMDKKEIPVKNEPGTDNPVYEVIDDKQPFPALDSTTTKL